MTQIMCGIRYQLKIASPELIQGPVESHLRRTQADIQQAAVIIRPSTLLRFHRLFKQRKYRRLYSVIPKRQEALPKGPSPELIRVIVEPKRLNPCFGRPRIAQQINNGVRLRDPTPLMPR